jgi:hypothetical protein
MNARESLARLVSRMRFSRPRRRPDAAIAALVLAASLLPGLARADGTFAVMSYNVKGLPPIPFVIGDRSEEMREIAEELEDFHTFDGPYVGMDSVVGLQEVFDQTYYNILTDPETVSYQHFTIKDNRGQFDTGDGLTVLSDFDLDNHVRTQWENCNGSFNEDGSDCDTPKGFSFTEVTLEDGAMFHLYTLHADAGQKLQDQEARRANITQLIEAINDRSPEGTPIIVLGDTNSRYTRVGTDNIQDLLTETGVTDVWVELRRDGIVPGAGPSITEDCETTPSTGNCEEVDKIFYRSGDGLVFEPKTYQVLRQMFMGTMTPLSDHDPVTVRFDYAIVTTTTTTSTSTTTTTLGDRPCGDPLGDSGVAASDALFVLRAAVGGTTCPHCICDVNDTATVTATDALVILKVAVGQTATFECPPCDGATSTTMSTTTTTSTTTTSSTTTTTML